MLPETSQQSSTTGKFTSTYIYKYDFNRAKIVYFSIRNIRERTSVLRFFPYISVYVAYLSKEGKGCCAVSFVVPVPVGTPAKGCCPLSGNGRSDSRRSRWRSYRRSEKSWGKPVVRGRNEEVRDRDVSQEGHFTGRSQGSRSRSGRAARRRSRSQPPRWPPESRERSTRYQRRPSA